MPYEASLNMEVHEDMWDQCIANLVLELENFGSDGHTIEVKKDSQARRYLSITLRKEYPYREEMMEALIDQAGNIAAMEALLTPYGFKPLSNEHYGVEARYQHVFSFAKSFRWQDEDKNDD